MKQTRLVPLTDRKVVYTDWDRIEVQNDIENGVWSYDILIYHQKHAKSLAWLLSKLGIKYKIIQRGCGIKSIVPEE